MIQLDMQNRLPIYEQLIEKLSELIILGALAPDEQLPSVRSLARDLGVNPNTVQKAYQELERAGIIYSVAGKGSFISSGNQAGKRFQEKSTAEIRQAAINAKRAGLTHAQIRDIVDAVFKEEHI